MNGVPPTTGWWLASDGRWYPLHLHPATQAPTGRSGWWVASDGKWYPPHLHPGRTSGRAYTPNTDPADPHGTAADRPRSPRPVAPSRRPRAFRRERWSPAMKFIAAVLGAVLVGSAAYGATLWIVGLNTGSSSQAKFGTVSNLTITAVATPTPTNLLYPHGTGDIVATITNPNKFPVTITKVKLPKSTVFGTGYTTSSLTTTKTGCGASATGSDVSWHYSSTTTSSAHTLHTAITVAASSQTGDPLTVTFTNDASVGTTASATCEGVYIKMPSLKGVTAYGGGNVTADTSPFTDKWTS